MTVCIYSPILLLLKRIMFVTLSKQHVIHDPLIITINKNFQKYWKVCFIFSRRIAKRNFLENVEKQFLGTGSGWWRPNYNYPFEMEFIFFLTSLPALLLCRLILDCRSSAFSFESRKSLLICSPKCTTLWHPDHCHWLFWVFRVFLQPHDVSFPRLQDRATWLVTPAEVIA